MAGTFTALQEAAPGLTVSSDAFHLRSTVLEVTPQLLSSRVEASPEGNAGPLHRHLRSQERFKLEQGRIRVRRGFRESLVIGPGEEATIPAGTPHTFAVEGDETAVFIAEFTPPWRIAEVFQELFAMPVDKRGNPRPADLAVLMHAYPEDFFYPPVVPPVIQRVLTWPLARFARR